MGRGSGFLCRLTLPLLESVRPADALPILEFNLGTTDMQIWGLPGGTLMQFEGSGIETVWKLEFPAPANPSGLTGVADVLITMDLRAQFGQGPYQAQLKQMPHTITKFVFVSALKRKLGGLADLQGLTPSPFQAEGQLLGGMSHLQQESSTLHFSAPRSAVSSLCAAMYCLAMLTASLGAAAPDPPTL
jgi:hypothetical protein